MMNDLVVKIGVRSFELRINDKDKIELDGKLYDADLKRISKNQFRLKLNGRQFQVFIDEQDDGNYITHSNGEINHISITTKLEEKAIQLLNNNSNNRIENKIFAPMSGLVVQINKKKGDLVNVGDSLLVLEAMKMENEIKSTLEGIVKEINCNVDNTIERGELLFIID